MFSRQSMQDDWPENQEQVTAAVTARYKYQFTTASNYHFKTDIFISNARRKVGFC